MKTSMGIVMSVWIPTEERLQQLASTLVQLSGEVGPEDMVCVMDECSPLRDKVADLIKSLQDSFQCALVCRTADIGTLSTQHTAPWHLAASRNEGAAVIRDLMHGGVAGYVFLDSDCAPLMAWRGYMVDWLGTHRGIGFGRTVHAKHPDTPAHDGDVVEFIGEVTIPPGAETVNDLPPLVTTFECVVDPLDPRLKASGCLPNWARELPWFPMASLMEQGGGGNMCVSAGLFHDVGGFDEVYCGGFGWEETDLAVRIFQAGGVVHYISGASVVHQYHPRGPEHWGDIQRNARLFRNRTGMFTGQRLPGAEFVKVDVSKGLVDVAGFDAGWVTGFMRGANAIRGQDPHINVIDAKAFMVLEEAEQMQFARHASRIDTSYLLTEQPPGGLPLPLVSKLLDQAVDSSIADRPVNWIKQFRSRFEHMTLADVSDIMTRSGVKPVFEPALDGGSDQSVSVIEYMDALNRRAELIVRVLKEAKVDEDDVEPHATGSGGNTDPAD